MELKEFIKAAITDITDAISELQGELENGAVVSPSVPHSVEGKTVCQGDYNRLISDIDFDVAITVGSTDSIGGKAKAGIQIISAKMSGNTESRMENVSRMSFSIPVIYPTKKVKTGGETTAEKNRETMHRSYRDALSSQSLDKD